MDKDRDPEIIKLMIRKDGRTLSGLAAAKRMTRQRLCRAMTRPDQLGERVIARALNENPESIWPSRYTHFGRRHNPQPTANYRRQSRFGRGGGQK